MEKIGNFLVWLVTTKLGWTLLAFISIFFLQGFHAPQWSFLIPVSWIIYAWIVLMISVFKNTFGKRKDE